MGPKRMKNSKTKKSATVGDESSTKRPKCCFCKRPGLLPVEQPLSDEDRK